MPKKKHFWSKLVMVASLALMSHAMIQPSEVRAEPAMPSSGNRQFNYPNRRPNINGDFYYLSSRIREHLNTTDLNPNYTNKGSVVRRTRGFLSEFTQDELNQIAVTRRKTPIQSSYHSTSRGGPPQAGSIVHAGNDSLGSLAPQFMQYFNGPLYNYKNLRHVKSNDKVFILNPAEVEQYVQLRGIDNRRNVDSRGYWLAGTQTYTTNVSRGQYVDRAGVYRHNGGAGTSTRGVVPALHLKPNAKAAKNLKIGDKITFGRYNSDNGEHSGPVQWEVINITDGYPLLWATKPIDYYPYNVNPQQNDNNTAYVFSELVRFDKYDIDITNDLKYHNPHGSHKEAPRMWLENKNDHQTRRIDSWDAVMRASSPAGIEWMESPDGARVYGDKITYTVSANDLGGRYPFRTKDKHQNYHGTHLPVGNIDEEVEVDILFSMPPTGWTNQPVVTTIQLSNQAVHGRNLSGTSNSGFSPFLPPSFTTYLNTRYHVKGQVRLRHLGGDEHKMLNNRYTSIYTVMNLSSPAWLKGEYMPSAAYGTNHSLFTVRDLVDAGVGNWIDFEYTHHITGNFLAFTGGIGVHRNFNTQTMNVVSPALEYRNLNISLLDTENFEIDRIILPDGKTVEDPPEIFQHTVYDEGTHSYRVRDNRGYWWNESITFKIDNEMPQIDIINIQ